MRGASVTVPIDIEPGSGVRRLAMRIAFDPAVVSIADARLATAAGLGVLDVRADVPGEVTLAVNLAQPVMNGATIVELQFSAVGGCNESTGLSFATCLLDDGAIGCRPGDGRIDVRCGVGGSVRSRRGGAVGNATVGLRGAPDAMAVTTTDELGQYDFPDVDVVSGTLELNPRKVGDRRGAISALDAALVLQATAGSRRLDGDQVLACDVTGNGQLSALDASRILQVATGKLSRLPVAESCDSDWVFVAQPSEFADAQLAPPPPGQTCPRGAVRVESLGTDSVHLDFRAMLYGDCSDNWSPPAQRPAGLVQSRDLRVWLGAARARPRGGWVVPVHVASPAGFQAIDARVAYDTTAVVPTALRAVGAARGAMVDFDVAGDGTLALALASAAPIADSSRPIAFLVFRPNHVVGTPAGRLLAAAVDEVGAGLAR